MSDDNWDLFAVVRSCSSFSSATSSSSATITATSDHRPLSLPQTKTDEDLQVLLKPFLLKPLVQRRSVSISPLALSAELQDPSPPQRAAQPPPPPPQQQPVKRHSVVGSVTPSPRSKRRKIQMKRVCQVAAEDLASDTWSWRKYGQKPIKGSPYPRGYYKCSTSKGCLARKQVERNRSDPGMFIVTYTADHNHPMPAHRNSLAGVSRLKPEGPTSTDPNKPSCSSPAMTAEKMEEGDEIEDFPEVDEEEDEFGGSDMAVGDDFFEGLEEFTGSGDGDSLPGHFMGNTAATAAGGGG